MRWAVQWRAQSRLDGKRERFFVWNGTLPHLFMTRRACRDFIKAQWGYIAEREDLRREPHGWKMPRPVRVRVALEAA
jgi:hypothetical protein